MITQKVLNLVAEVGENLKASRLRKNLTQQELALKAGIGIGRLKAIEAGEGASFSAIVALSLALGEERWIQALSPTATVNPLTMLSSKQPRQRARKKAHA